MGDCTLDAQWLFNHFPSASGLLHVHVNGDWKPFNGLKEAIVLKGGSYARGRYIK